jgi:hypothetical protein
MANMPKNMMVYNSFINKSPARGFIMCMSRKLCRKLSTAKRHVQRLFL